MTCVRCDYTCELCGRKHRKDHMTWHHLLPSVGGEGRSEPTVYVCQTCHIVIHACHSNEELRNEYNSLNKLLESEKINRMINLYKYKSEGCIFTLKRLKKYEIQGVKNDRREKGC
jgi:hypothetical protein